VFKKVVVGLHFINEIGKASQIMLVDLLSFTSLQIANEHTYSIA
jgi:hypothetical protein